LQNFSALKAGEMNSKNVYKGRCILPPVMLAQAFH